MNWLRIIVVLTVAVIGFVAWTTWNLNREPEVRNSPGQWRSAREIVSEHLRLVEAGDWTRADAMITPDFSMTGTIPFPISLIVRIGKAQSMQMHKPRKRAMPDFKFNETVLEESPNRVKLQVNLTGTQTGVIDYTGVLNGIPVIPPTGKKLRLAPEFFTYFVRDDQITRIIGEIPKGAGVQGLVDAVTK